MSDDLGRFSGLDPAGSLFSVSSLLASVMLAAVVTLAGVMAFGRAAREGIEGALARVALVLIGAGVAWSISEVSHRRDVTAERMALEARIASLLMPAATAGSALACLDTAAGATVEASCEKALFASPEATAAAVSYVSAQLALLADLEDYVRRSGRDAKPPVALAALRRAVETDRFGFVAHVLATRDGCTAQVCPTLALVRDRTRIASNLTDRAYEFYVLRHAAHWPALATTPVAGMPEEAAEMAAHAPAVTASVSRPPSELFFPNSASIPPVDIMNAEPALAQPATTGSATPARQAAPPRRTTQPGSNGQAKSGAVAPSSGAPARAPVDLNALSPGPPAYAPQ